MNKRFLLYGVCLVLVSVWSCSGPDQGPINQNADGLPLGSWLMYGGQRGLLKASMLDQEETTLVLADSTYSLTFQRPNAKFIFVESGKVYYDVRAQVARFTVMSASGIDWSSGEPRKLVLQPETVPFQRDPGTTYGMGYMLQDSLMSLAGGGKETSWFVKSPQ
jgi:hypothetical protein